MKVGKHKQLNTIKTSEWVVRLLVALLFILFAIILLRQETSLVPVSADKDEVQPPSTVPYLELHVGKTAKRPVALIEDIASVESKVTNTEGEALPTATATINEEAVTTPAMPILIDSKEKFLEHMGKFGLAGEFHLTWEEYDQIVRTVAGECGGIYAEPYEGHVAVAQCVRDRLLSDEWPNTIEEILVPGQFASPYEGSMELYSNCYYAVWEVFVLDVSAFAEPVIYFMNPDASAPNAAEWIRSHHYVGTIGGHEFYS